jgi:hypothetical protein
MVLNETRAKPVERVKAKKEDQFASNWPDSISGEPDDRERPVVRVDADY